MYDLILSKDNSWGGAALILHYVMIVAFMLRRFARDRTAHASIGPIVNSHPRGCCLSYSLAKSSISPRPGAGIFITFSIYTHTLLYY